MEKNSWQEFLRDRIKAMFLLVAIGDALGMPVETFTPKKIAEDFGRIKTYFDPPKDHKWHGDGKLKKGMWTDDCQLTMTVEQSMIRMRKIDMDDLAQSHVSALHESESGWGGSTTLAVKNIENKIHWSKSGIPDAAGNGISMKIAPFGALLAITTIKILDEDGFMGTGKRLEKFKGDFHSSIVELTRMTHQSRMAIASGIAQSYAVFSAITGEKDFANDFLEFVHDGCLLGESFRYVDNVQDKLSDVIEQLKSTRDYEKLSLEEIIIKYGGKGKARFYVYNSLPLSYAIFLRNPYSIETLFDAVNAGGDTDTNASMVGALLGARNGMQILEGYEYLIDGLWRKEEIIETAKKFCDTFITK